MADQPIDSAAVRELNAIFERHVDDAYVRYDSDPVFHRKVKAVANVLVPQLDAREPDATYALAKRLALRAIVAVEIIERDQS